MFTGQRIPINNNLGYQDYLNIIQKGVLRPLCRIEWLRREDESVRDQIVKLPLDGSNLTVDASSGIRRSVNLILDNSQNDFIPNTDTFWIDQKFSLYLGLEDEYKNQIWFLQGVFVLNNNPEIKSNYAEKTVSLKCDDKFSILENTQVGNIYIVQQGTHIKDAIQAILKICGDPQVLLFEDGIIDVCPNELRWTEDANYGQIVKDLANLYSREVFYDKNGQLVVRKFVDQNTVAPSIDLGGNNCRIYMGSSRTMKWQDVKNHIYVIGTNSNSNTIYYGEAKNEDLTSATCIQLIGEHPLVIQDSKIWSNALCIQRAEMELEQRRRIQENLNLICLPLIHCDVNTAITLTDRSLNLDHARYVIQQFSLPLDCKSGMNITAFLYSDTSDYMDRWTESINQ